MFSSSIVVDGIGTSLSYHDSGPPVLSQYPTIFAIHGTCFSSLVFQRVMALAPTRGIRFVSITRRHHPGSTVLSENELRVILSGSEDEKDSYLRARGVEILMFIDKFIVRHSLPPISEDGRNGGIAILGYDHGNTASLAAVANLYALSRDARARVASQLRTVIIQDVENMTEPASMTLGLTSPDSTWAPLVDDSIPAEARIPMFAQWVTSYFKHQKNFLQSRNLSDLEYVVPSTSRAPSIFNMSASENATIITNTSSVPDLPLALNFETQLSAVYQRACFSASVRKLAPHMKVWYITGDASPSFALAALWQVQDDNAARGGGYVNHIVVPGVNHLMHWDEPEITLNVYQEALEG